MDHKKKFEQVFWSELGEIHNHSIKYFLLFCVELSCQDYFWLVPASQTGHHHPLFANGPGGLVRHTQYAFWWAQELMQVYELTSDQKDEVRAAILLHDMMKLGYNPEARIPKANHIHGLWLVQDILSKLPDEYHLQGYHTSILNAIMYHMGRWTEPRLEGSPSTVTCIVHLADYVASRQLPAPEIFSYVP